MLVDFERPRVEAAYEGQVGGQVAVSAARRAVVDDPIDIVNVRADTPDAVRLHAGAERDIAQPVKDIGVAGVVPVAGVVGIDAVEERGQFGRQRNFVEMDAVFDPEDDAMRAGKLYKLGEGAPRRSQVWFRQGGTALFYLPAGRARLETLARWSPAQPPVHVDELRVVEMPQVEYDGAGPDPRGRFDAPASVVERFVAMFTVERGKVQVGIRNARACLFPGRRLVDCDDRQDVRLNNAPQFVHGG